MNFGPYDDEYYYVKKDRRLSPDDPDQKPVYIGAVPKDEWTDNNRTGYTNNPNQIMKFEPNILETRIEQDHPGQIGDLNDAISGFLVLPWVYDMLRFFPIRGVQWMHAVYYDIYDQIHEPMHFMKFYEMMDYWSRERSTLLFPYDEDNPDERAEIDQLSLDENKFSVIPEDERLAFMLGGTGFPDILFHARIAEPLIEKEAKGVRFFKITKYEDGMEYQ
ncbi:hypothetical protein [Parasulfitobacter algicola]|uniref:Uncharacterized protein n=1 Tax=Parasulfitobacter algicola TaxID=2614809 RepID=A0ABX2IXE7_9RHOB|nr:hypothetical protein [Sulfitobacter algicola]NSX55732.1 hypothetical protein [Sulfitobacter algicola]